MARKVWGLSRNGPLDLWTDKEGWVRGCTFDHFNDCCEYFMTEGQCHRFLFVGNFLAWIKISTTPTVGNEDSTFKLGLIGVVREKKGDIVYGTNYGTSQIQISRDLQSVCPRSYLQAAEKNSHVIRELREGIRMGKGVWKKESIASNSCFAKIVKMSGLVNVMFNQ